MNRGKRMQGEALFYNREELLDITDVSIRQRIEEEAREALFCNGEELLDTTEVRDARKVREALSYNGEELLGTTEVRGGEGG